MGKQNSRHEIALDQKGQEQPQTKHRALDPSSKEQPEPDTEHGKFPERQRKPQAPAQRSQAAR